jgi:hypothetical protein
MRKRFWLTWDSRKNDFARRETGQTLGELAAEARVVGRHWSLRRVPGGVWFEFDPESRSISSPYHRRSPR